MEGGGSEKMRGHRRKLKEGTSNSKQKNKAAMCMYSKYSHCIGRLSNLNNSLDCTFSG
jgi:hypothetical protein